MPFILEIELQGAKLRGHDLFWSIINRIAAGGSEFTLLDVVGKTNAHKATVNDYVKRLVRGGYLKEAGWQGEGHWRQRTYELVRKSAETPSLRRDGTPGFFGRGRQQMWNVLRSPLARGGIAADDLAMYAATDDVPVAALSASEYLRLLHRAGYLRLKLTARERARHSYTLIRDTGPLAPKVLRTGGKVVFDQNQRMIFDILTGEEEEAA